MFIYLCYIPVAFWFVRFDVQRKMSGIEEKNAGIAVATASIFDKENGHFSPQKVDKINRHGYITIKVNNKK